MYINLEDTEFSNLIGDISKVNVEPVFYSLVNLIIFLKGFNFLAIKLQIVNPIVLK